MDNFNLRLVNGFWFWTEKPEVIFISGVNSAVNFYITTGCFGILWQFGRPISFQQLNGTSCGSRRLRGGDPGWPGIQIILCTLNCQTKKQLKVFYGHSMESRSAINLYGQLMTLMVLCMVIQWFSSFSWNFFSTTNFHFFSYIVSSNSKGLEKFNWNAQQLSELNFPRFCYERRTFCFLLVCPTLHQCRLYFSGMGFLKTFF